MPTTPRLRASPITYHLVKFKTAVGKLQSVLTQVLTAAVVRVCLYIIRALLCFRQRPIDRTTIRVEPLQQYHTYTSTDSLHAIEMFHIARMEHICATSEVSAHTTTTTTYASHVTNSTQNSAKHDKKKKHGQLPHHLQQYSTSTSIAVVQPKR